MVGYILRVMDTTENGAKLTASKIITSAAVVKN
jgi:hypothetical protein